MVWLMQLLYISPLGGPLTPSAVQARFERVFNLNFMNVTMMAELARWGYVPGTYWCKLDSVWTYQKWVEAYPNVRDTFFPVRTSNVLSQYSARGMHCFWSYSSADF